MKISLKDYFSCTITHSKFWKINCWLWGRGSGVLLPRTTHVSPPPLRATAFRGVLYLLCCFRLIIIGSLWLLLSSCCTAIISITCTRVLEYERTSVLYKAAASVGSQSKFAADTPHPLFACINSTSTSIGLCIQHHNTILNPQ
jgi:hypothetical protein